MEIVSQVSAQGKAESVEEVVGQLQGFIRRAADLGVTALESVGILVDPVNKTLKRLPAIPLKRFAKQ